MSLSPQASWAEPRPSQATDMALACCFLGKVLWVGCRYSPHAFRHSNIRRQVPPRLQDARDNSSEIWARILYSKFSRNDGFHATLGIFYMLQSTTWDRRLHFPCEGRRAEDPTASAGVQPANSGNRGEHPYP